MDDLCDIPRREIAGEVETLEELDSLLIEEIVAGYMAGYDDHINPPIGKSRAYIHGWLNAVADRTGKISHAQFRLVTLVVERNKRLPSLRSV